MALMAETDQVAWVIGPTLGPSVDVMHINGGDDDTHLDALNTPRITLQDMLPDLAPAMAIATLCACATMIVVTGIG